ncbi:hypothetical protein A1OO_08410 [Enterovibrio norvegicus FF-33]|uniref:Transcriptional regulator n=1 Tax=Enterovibrio norvegicus FF-454 TaxID=1185651 RepID=A0A1E5C9P0_9GAMM|nr:hypothetical protein [Enterovibrio norvegicus]OEE62238.1 hypothetical protein A1OK_01640 [Enterovibrio norvegicus FF-454]OEE65823.1 hypothetical protein A1OO_08410 [Enterovibrio norvegicus FF-33]OEE89145.1 hypothetical protein A1OQ_12185 [Enterovibrio norvegicus FF-162]
MDAANIWLEDIKSWYSEGTSSGVNGLANLITNTPSVLFAPPISQTQSDAIAYFVDGCEKLQRLHQSEGRIDEAYNYLQFCYAKLQSLASHADVEKEVKRWSLKKLDTIIVGMMEFCQQQQDNAWIKESEVLVELHVAFMQGQNGLNLYQSHRSFR